MPRQENEQLINSFIALSEINITEDNSDAEIIEELKKLNIAQNKAEEILKKYNSDQNYNEYKETYEKIIAGKSIQIAANIKKRHAKLAIEIEESVKKDYENFVEKIQNMLNFNKIYGEFINSKTIEELKEHYNFLKKEFEKIKTEYNAAKSYKEIEKEKIFGKMIYELGAIHLDGEKQQACLLKTEEIRKASRSFGQKIMYSLPFMKSEEDLIAINVRKNLAFDDILSSPFPFYEKQLHNKMKQKVFTGKGINIDKGESGEQSNVKLTRSTDGRTGTIELTDKNFSGVLKLARINKNGDLLNSYDYLTFENGKIVPQKCIFCQKGKSIFNLIIEGDGTRLEADQNKIKYEDENKQTRKFEEISKKDFAKKLAQEIYKNVIRNQPPKNEKELSSYFQHNDLMRFIINKTGLFSDVKFDRDGNIDFEEMMQNISSGFSQETNYTEPVKKALKKVLKEYYPGRNFEKYITEDGKDLTNVKKIDYKKNTPEVVIEQMQDKQKNQGKQLEKQLEEQYKRKEERLNKKEEEKESAQSVISPAPSKHISTNYNTLPSRSSGQSR